MRKLLLSFLLLMSAVLFVAPQEASAQLQYATLVDCWDGANSSDPWLPDSQSEICYWEWATGELGLVCYAYTLEQWAGDLPFYVFNIQYDSHYYGVVIQDCYWDLGRWYELMNYQGWYGY